MELQVNEELVIPTQNLERKIAIVAKIVEIFPCDRDGRRVITTINQAQNVRVQIKNRSDILNGSSGIVYRAKDFRRFIEEYQLTAYEDLMGKPVISVYTENAGQMLCGLIPLVMDK